jgi:hypothetical protein
MSSEVDDAARGAPGSAGPSGEGATVWCGGPPQAQPLLIDPLAKGTLWDVVCLPPDRSPEQSDDMYDHTGQLWAGGSMVAAAHHLQVLSRLRAELDRTPAEAAPSDPIVLRASDAVAIARLLLRKLA